MGQTVKKQMIKLTKQAGAELGQAQPELVEIRNFTRIRQKILR